MKIQILLWILFFLIGLLIVLNIGCRSKDVYHPFSTIRPLEENKYEIAGKEIYEGMVDD